MPVTIRQLALATRLPYETVRRQAQNLVRDGYCVFVPKQGVMTPTEVFQRPKFLASGRYVVTAMQRLLADLQRCGFDFDTIARAGRAAQPDAMTVGRAVIRLNGEYTMNQLEVLRVPHNNDPVEALIFMAIAAANRRQADGAEADGVLPDALRRPISALAAASSLNIPYETVRRLLNRMEKSGRLARAKDGFFVPAEVERRIEDEEMLRKRYVCLLRYLADLKFIGVPMPA